MNFLSPELLPLASRLGWVLLHSLWLGALVALITAIALRLLRSASPATRYAVCLLTLIGFVALSGFAAARILPAPRPAVTPAATQNTSTPVQRVEMDRPATPGQPSSIGIPGNSSRPETVLSPTVNWPRKLETLTPWLAALWLTGIAALSLRHIGGWWSLRVLRRSGCAPCAELGAQFADLLSRFVRLPAVRLLTSIEATGPLLVGLTKPVILLPIQATTGLSRSQVEAILAHEIAHLARHDAWTNLALVVVETLFFYHPLVWWLGRRIRQEREEAADDLAMTVIGDRRTYAGALAALAEIEVAGSLALAARGGNLTARIRRILAPAPASPSGATWSLSLPILLATTAALIATNLRARAQDAITVAPGESIQAAIDRAPAGSVVRLAAGEWKERIEINKPITLEGAGWEKTILRVAEPTHEGLEETRKKMIEMARLAQPGAEEEKASLEWARQLMRPGILVLGAGPVHLRSLRVAGQWALGNTGRVTSDSLVVYLRASGSITDCAITGPYMHGISLQGSDLEMKSSLVTALWGTGVAASGSSENSTSPASRLHLAGCEVRLCNHRGITLGPGCDTSVIEGNRISGSAWHGIRYDHASPTVTGNTIFNNARSGIYASGKTQATVRGNLFWRNEMNGISCWFANADRIEANTFVDNLREGLAVVGGATPAVSGNIFARNRTAVVTSPTQQRNGELTKPGEPTLGVNLFWENRQDLVVVNEPKPLPAGSVQTDPHFRDEAKQDFASSAKMGAATPLSPTGPWPALLEEKGFIPMNDPRVIDR